MIKYLVRVIEDEEDLQDFEIYCDEILHDEEGFSFFRKQPNGQFFTYAYFNKSMVVFVIREDADKDCVESYELN